MYQGADLPFVAGLPAGSSHPDIHMQYSTRSLYPTLYTRFNAETNLLAFNEEMASILLLPMKSHSALTGTHKTQ